MKESSYALSGWCTMLFGCAMCLLLASCGPESKSVTEPLSIEERQELINKDAGYAATFSVLDALERFGELSASEKKTMEELSYKQLKNFLSAWGKGEKLDKKKTDYANKWEEKYGSYRVKVDSIDHYWKQFLEDYQAKNYLKVELMDIVDKTDVVFGYVKVRLQLTPLKGRVDKVKANFGLLLKTDKYGAAMSRNEITVNTPFSSTITQDGWMKFNYAFDIDADKVKKLPVSQLLEVYDFRTNITQLVVDGRSIDYTKGYFQVPDCVRSLWQKRADEKDWENSFMKELYYTKVFQELTDSTMPAKDDYVDSHIKEDAYRDDKSAATFYYEIFKKKTSIF